MLPQYRVIKQDITSSSIEYMYYTSLREAHKACLPNKELSKCHLMFNGLEAKIANGENLIRVTCYSTVVYWIELILGKDHSIFPKLPSKIECSHLD
uniref:Uncharacterized protein n=1 Tax=viral metagenome TaxID=1070528 RepID=A0A6C0AM84_9ZZZZ